MARSTDKKPDGAAAAESLGSPGVEPPVVEPPVVEPPVVEPPVVEPPVVEMPVVEPPWWTKPKPSRRRQPMSRDAIVKAALTIVDEEGIDALTVRRLGEALNTGSATLYWHIGSKNELAEMVYDHVMGELELPEPDPANWQHQIKAMAFDLYRLLLRHKDLVRLSLGHLPTGPNTLRVAEWNVAVLRGAGIPDQVVSYFGDVMSRYLDASVLESTTQTGPPMEMVGEYFRSLPPDRFPNMLALMPTAMVGSDEERFGFGLDLLLRGLADYLANS